MTALPHLPLLRVCAADDLDRVAGAIAPTIIVSLVDDPRAQRLARAWGARHLAVPVPDLSNQGDAPWARNAATRLLTLGATVKPTDRVLVHCKAGVSRSPAALLILDIARAHAAGFPLDDALVAGVVDRLRAHHPQSLPNGSLLDAADALLGAKGAVSRARKAFSAIRWS